MKPLVKTLLTTLTLILICTPALAQDGGAGADADSCYGFVGSVDKGTTMAVSFCATHHSCKIEKQRAGNAICGEKFASACAERPCPEGQECVPIELGGSEGIELTECSRYPAPEGMCLGDEICACNATLTKRLDCGCVCREAADADPVAY